MLFTLTWIPVLLRWITARTSDIALLKVQATLTAESVYRECLQILGGAGYIRDSLNIRFAPGGKLRSGGKLLQEIPSAIEPQLIILLQRLTRAAHQ
ncbi:acyl-CoA dehydrogenase family protein [Bacterioplanoides pacificum]|uniref:Acyl-CoA dehydrogenase family protein n=1 Tax=Bacterioplanoides pacificum TaxID=1171596 RepID=A0ABV7VT38_9GAMM